MTDLENEIEKAKAAGLIAVMRDLLSKLTSRKDELDAFVTECERESSELEI